MWDYLTRDQFQPQLTDKAQRNCAIGFRMNIAVCDSFPYVAGIKTLPISIESRQNLQGY